MRCKICHENITKGADMKGGKICVSCFTRLPFSAQHHIQSLNKKQILKIQSVFKQAKSTPKLSFGGFHLCFDSIILNGFEISIKDIQNIELGFHVKQHGKMAGSCIGNILLIIKTTQGFEVREPFYSRDVTVKYYIYNNNIVYSFDNKIQNVVSLVQRAIDSHSPDLSDMLAKLECNQTVTEPPVRAVKKLRPTAQTEKNLTDVTDAAISCSVVEPRISIVGEEDEKTEFENALCLYQITVPFTLQQLSAVRKQLQKMYHSDCNGGGDTESNGMSSLINHYYEVLKRYAIKA